MLDPQELEARNEFPPASPQIAPASSAADLQLNATLAALNAVQPPARLEQRIHARLSQEQLAPAKSLIKSPVFIPANLRAAVRQAWSLPRLAFAASAFVAGVATTVLLMPLIHGPSGNRPAGNAAAPAGVATQIAAPTSSPAQPAAVAAGTQPGYTVAGAGGRISAMSRAGTVAEARARRQNGDPQLAANKQQRKNTEAKLAKPDQPAPTQ